MRISIHPDILNTWPAAALGIVFVQEANNQADLTAWQPAQQAMEESVRELFPTAEAVGQHPAIQAWRKAYRAFGCDPHKYRCSSEALARQVLKGNTIWGINPLVDCYNYISLKYTVPVGGEDCAQVAGDVILKKSAGTEPFVRLGGTENEPPEVGEVIYVDNLGVLCRRWNWREADRTKLTANTTSAILVIEAISPMTLEQLQAATKELAELVTTWCGATAQQFILNRDQASCVIE